MRFLKKSARIFVSILAVCLLAGYVYAQQIRDSVPLYPLMIETAHKTHKIKVELADTPESLAQGLMGRKHLADDRGMLFVFPETRDVSFWMRNTLIPLDLVYMTEDGVINHIHPMAQPLDETPLPSKGGPIKAVLEIAGGQAEAKQIQIGDKIKTPLLEGTRK